MSASAAPTPRCRTCGATPIGPTKPRAMASMQQKPTMASDSTAMKKPQGWRDSALRVLLAQPGVKWWAT